MVPVSTYSLTSSLRAWSRSSSAAVASKALSSSSDLPIQQPLPSRQVARQGRPHRPPDHPRTQQLYHPHGLPPHPTPRPRQNHPLLSRQTRANNEIRYPFNVEININHEYWHLRENDLTEHGADENPEGGYFQLIDILCAMSDFVNAHDVFLIERLSPLHICASGR